MSLISCQMILVISSPSRSTTLPTTLILLILLLISMREARMQPLAYRQPKALLNQRILPSTIELGELPLPGGELGR